MHAEYHHWPRIAQCEIHVGPSTVLAFRHSSCVYIYIYTYIAAAFLLAFFPLSFSLFQFRFACELPLLKPLLLLARYIHVQQPYPCHIAASSFVFLSISMFTKRLPAPLTCSPSRTLFSCQEKVCKASLDRYTRSDVSLHRYERKRDSGSVYTRREIYICTFLFFPRSTRDRITIVRYT